MNERQVRKVLTEALDRGLVLGFSRQRGCWKVQPRSGDAKKFSQAEVTRYARRLSQRL